MNLTLIVFNLVRVRIITVFVFMLLFQLVNPLLSLAASFEGLGDFPGGAHYSEANGISADGKTVVGASNSEQGLEAFIWAEKKLGSYHSGKWRWFEPKTLLHLGDLLDPIYDNHRWNDLPGGSFMSRAVAIHPDGLVGGIIGYSSSGTGTEGFYWSNYDGMRGIGQFTYGNHTALRGISRGGYVGVANWDHYGKLSSPRNRAMYLTRTNFSMPKYHCLNDPGNPFYCPNKVTIDAAYQYYEPASSFNAVSDNGIKVGWKENYALYMEGYTQKSLGFLSGDTTRPRSFASDISGNGQVVVGSSTSYTGWQAFRWTESTGMQGLGFSAGSIATSYDGSVIVGSNSNKAFIWTETSGMQYLQDILTNESGLDLTGWRLLYATDLTEDGLIVIGNGINPSGQREGWIAHLDALPTSNKSPIANAGPDQTVPDNTLVQLDGSASTDPDGNYPLAYSWSITQKPAGSVAILSDSTIAIPTFTSDVMGDYTIELIVTDSKGKSSAPDTIIISTVNSAPIAVIDVPSGLSVIQHGTTVQLNGGGSSDPDGDILTFNWTLIPPAGSLATLLNPGEIMPSFDPDMHGNYLVELVVIDPYGASSPKVSVVVTFDNIPPVASANYVQAGQVLIEGDTIDLLSSGIDTNLDAISDYTWTLVAPAGSTSALDDVNAQNTAFVADIGGVYDINIIVQDEHGLDSTPANLQITVLTQAQAVTDVFNDLVTMVTTILTPDDFNNANQQNALSNKLDAVFGLIGQGKYAQALGKLQNDILEKTDGCATTGSVDGNDWIDICAVQQQVYPLVTDLIYYLSK